MERDSMINSISLGVSRFQDTNQSQIEGFESEDVKKLRNSVRLIERDLGVADDEEGKAGNDRVADIVRKSIVSLEMTPIRRYTDVSDTSMRLDDSYIIPSSNSES